jgi:CheY-like chemotaxis protein
LDPLIQPKAMSDPRPTPPLPFSPSEEPSEGERLIQTLAGTRARVLIAEADDAERKLIGGMCELFDCAGHLAKDGVEAVEAFSAMPFDIVLMGVDLPRMDGLEAARAIRGNPKGGGLVPILAVTSRAAPDELSAYREAGMTGVLEKPVAASRLLSAITEALAAAPEPQRPSQGAP